MNPATINKTNWNEQLKIKPRRNASIKHEVIKTMIVLNLLEKYKKFLYWIRVYTEYPLSSNGKTKISDVYFENIKSNEIICYEIQNKVTDKWMNETKAFYDNFERIYFKTGWSLIREENLSEDIKTLNKEIKELII